MYTVFNVCFSPEYTASQGLNGEVEGFFLFSFLVLIGVPTAWCALAVRQLAQKNPLGDVGS